VAAHLQPAAELAVQVQQEPAPGGVDDEGAAGDVAGQRSAGEARGLDGDERGDVIAVGKLGGVRGEMRSEARSWCWWGCRTLSFAERLDDLGGACDDKRSWEGDAMRWIAVGGLLGVTLAACGASSPPCKASACPNVAGTYAITITQSSNTTCTEINYGGTEGEAIITQDGSALTLTLPGSPLNESESGTLDVNNTATFGASGSVNVSTEFGELPYSDTNSITVSFAAQPGGVFNVSGTMSDNLSETGTATPNGPDANCFLSANITGTD
jgi:hypothetical protein